VVVWDFFHQQYVEENGDTIGTLTGVAPFNRFWIPKKHAPVARFLWEAFFWAISYKSLTRGQGHHTATVSSGHFG